MAAGGFHDDPALDRGDAPGAELFQAGGLGLLVVSLDVDVDAAVVVDALDRDVGLVRRALQRDVLAFVVLLVDLVAQRLGPETRGGHHVVRLVAIDDEAAQSALVHGGGPLMDSVA